jgi:fibronectin-binding autotransporter adhesin
MKYRAFATPATTRNQAHHVTGADFTGETKGRTPATAARSRTFTRFLAGSVAALLALHSAHAVTLTWDATAGALPLNDGAGAWLGANQWYNGATWQSWVSGSDAVFGVGGAGGAVTLASPTTVNSLTFNTFTGTYTLGTAGQTITLNAGITISASAAAVTIISPVTLSGSQSWTNGSASTFTVSGAVIDGTNILTLNGTGNGLTTLTNGLSISGAGGLVIGKSGTNGTTITGTSTLGGTGGITINSGASAVGLGVNTVSASQSWTNNSATTFTVSGLTTAGANTLTLAGSGNGLTTLTGGLSFTGAGGLVISKTGTLGTSIGGTSTLGGSGGITINSGASAVSLAAATIATAQSWANNSSNVMNVTGTVLFNNQLSLTAGTFRLTGNNIGAGGVLVNGATVQAGINAAFGTGTLTLTSGTVSSDGVTARSFTNAVTLNGSVTLGNATNNGALTFTGTKTITGSNTITLAGTGAETFSGGGMSLAAGSNTTFSSASAALNLTGGFTTNGGTDTLTLNTGANAVNLSGAFTGAAGILDLAGSGTNVTVGGLTTTANAIRVSGTGSYTFNGASTFTGGVILNNASATVIATTVGGSLGTGGKVKFNVAGTTLRLQNNGNLTFTSGLDSTANGGTIVVNRATASATPTTHTLSLANTLGANTIVMSAGANITTGTAYGFTLSGATTLNGPATFETNNNGAGIGTLTIGGIISGNGSLTKTGAGNMILSGVNTYTGSTTVAAGRLTMGVAGALPSTTDLILGTASSSVAGIVDLKLFSQTVNSIALAAGNTGGSANTITDSSPGSGGTLTVSSTTTNSTFAGSLAGVIALTKSGTGTILTLTGTNTYTGPTKITDGTLEVALGSTVNGSSQVYAGFDVSNNGTLLFTGGTMTSTGAGYLGNVVNSAGTATINSGSWTIQTDALYVGNFGTGALNIAAGGSIIDPDGYIGFQMGSTGTATISGGTWTNSQGLYVGYIGDGTMNVTGGNVTDQSGFVGYDAASTGIATVSGGTWSNTSDLTVGFDGTGTLNITSTGVVSVDTFLFGPGTGTVSLAENAGSIGTLNLGTGGVAGTLSAAEVNGGAGTATVNFNHTGTYSFAPRLTGSLAVNKLGPGKTNLTATNTYTGATTVSGGTLAITGSATGTGSIKVNSGGTLLLNSTANASNYVGNGSAVPVPLTNLAVVLPGTTTFTGNGGTLAVATGQSGTTHTFSSMTLSANSTLDFSNGPGTTNTGVNLFFGSLDAMTVAALQAGTMTLNIDNWTSPNYYNPGATADTGFFGDGQDRLLFTSDPGFGLGVAIPGITFNGGVLGQEVSFGGMYEIVPVPEPTTVLGAAGLLGFLGYRERRRVRGLWKGRILPKLASLLSFFRLARTWLAVLAVTLAFLGGSTLQADGFFNDGILRGTQSIHAGEVTNRGSLINSPFTLDPAPDAFVGIGFKLSDAPALIAAPEVRQPALSQESLGLVSVPEPTAILGVLGVLGFIGFRERRRVRDLWNRSIGRRLPSLGLPTAKPAKA